MPRTQTALRRHTAIPTALAALLSVLLFSAPAPARADAVMTLDGHTYDGDARLLSTGEVFVSQKNSAPIKLRLENILYASFNDAMPPRNPANDDTGPLTSYTIGDSDRDAEAFYVRGFYALRNTGNISGATDTCRMIGQGLYGNGELVVRLLDIGAPNALAGLMIRQESDPKSIQVSFVADAKGKMSLRYRSDAGGKTTLIDAGKTTFPIYMRLTRTDQQFRAFTSSNGIRWDLAARLYDDDKPADEKSKPAGVDMDYNALSGMVIAASGASPADAGSVLFDQFTSRKLYESVSVPAKPAPAQFIGASIESLRKGILLRTGTFLATATVTTLEQGKALVTRGDQTMTIDLADVATLRTRNLSPTILSHVPEHAAGILLSSGDFMEGDVTRLDKEQVEVSNVTLGLSTYRLDSKVQAILIRDANSTPAGYRIRLQDGSLLVARGMKIDSANLIADDYLLGNITLPLKEVLSIQGAADRAATLLSQRPTIEGRPGMIVESVSCLDPAAKFWLSAAGSQSEQGLVMPAGAAATYRVPPGVRSFIARLAVPERLPSLMKIRFILTVDGQDIFRSEDLSSRDLPKNLNLPLESAKTLTLRVESTSGGDLPAFGVWCNPVLVR